MRQLEQSSRKTTHNETNTQNTQNQTYQVVALKRGRRSSHCASADHLHRKKKTKETDCQVQHTRSVLRGCADAEADMPSAEASGARCVQNFDGSRNSAIHTTYRISLRSSSIREPRYPLLRVVIWFVRSQKRQSTQRRHHNHDQDASETQKHWYVGVCSSRCMQKQHRWCTQRRNHHHHNNTQSRKNKTTKTV